MNGATATRATELERLFVRIAATRMDGVPMLHPGLRVQAVGFEAVDGAAVGVLVTPWFMNLVWLPLPGDGVAPEAATRVGETRRRSVGREVFPFIGAFEDGFGAYEACSLFSPMFEFVDQAAALATAQAVLDSLRAPEPAPEPVQHSRRALLFGRAPTQGVTA